MRNTLLVAFCFMILIQGHAVFAQQTTPSGVPGTQSQRERNEQDFNRRSRQLDTLNKTRGRNNVLPTKRISRAEKRRFKKATTPNEEDVLKYKEFLKEKNTGIFKINPDFDCETNFSKKIDGKCENFVSRTWVYSFRKKAYNGEGLQDIVYKRDKLLLNGLLNQGLIVALGDVAIEEVSLESDGLKKLTDFMPADNRLGAVNQFMEITNGIKEENFLYTNYVVPSENTTYAMRIVAYRLISRFGWQNANRDDYDFYNLKTDKRKDMIITFRVVRKTRDGSLTILWKELDNKKSPKLVFKKIADLADIRPETLK